MKSPQTRTSSKAPDAPAPDLLLLNAMRRHKRLIKAYKGAAPADRHLKQELAWAIDAYISDNVPQMRKMTERLNAALPPMGMSEARARRLGIAKVDTSATPP